MRKFILSLSILSLLGAVHAQIEPIHIEPIDGLPTTPEPENHPGTYLVTAPKIVRPGRPYAISLVIMKSREERHIVTVQIQDFQNNTVAFKIENDVKMGVPTTITIDKIDPTKIIAGTQYKLYVKAESIANQVIFEETNTVDVDHKAISIFIQTDKAIYKPGSEVKMRAVFIDPNLKPIDDLVHMKVYDPSQNLMAQWTNQSLDTGVLSKSIQLADETPLGDWVVKTQAVTTGMEAEKSFSVEKYVLPKFEVTVVPPPFTTQDKELVVTVKGKYTYGKGVGGKATLLVKDAYNFRNFQPIILDQIDLEAIDGPRPSVSSDRGIEKTSPLENGEAVFRFTPQELKIARLTGNDASNTIELVGTVTEELTGISRNNSEQITVYSEDYKVKIEQSTETFKPGLTYNVIVSVVQPDDSPIPSDYPRKIKIFEEYTWPWNSTQAEQRQEKTDRVVTLDATGSKAIELEPPVGAESMYVYAIYDRTGDDQFDKLAGDNRYGPHSASMSVTASVSPTDSFLQLTSTKKSGAPGDKIHFNVDVTDKVQNGEVVAQVLSRGVVVQSKNVKLDDLSGQVVIELTPEMAPQSRLVVYGIVPENQEIIVDATDFDVSDLLQNKVELSLSAAQKQPGESVSINVKADPSSYVGLLGIDQSVLLLKSGNDITVDEVEADFEQYNSAHGGGGNPWIEPRPFLRGKRSIWWPYWYSGKDAKTLFNNAGLVVLTDAYLYSEPNHPNPSIAVFDMMVDQAVAGVSANKLKLEKKKTRDDSSKTVAETPIVRSNFIDTWLWTSLKLSADGQLSYEATVPDTITSFVVSAFAVSNTNGLGVAPETKKLKVFRPFFVRFNLPYSVKRGEKIALQALIFNYEDSPQTVTLTLAHNASSGFDFVSKDGAALSPTEQKDNYNARQIRVPGDGGSASVFFPIVPTKIGEVVFDLTAIGTTMSDRIQVPLKVEPEGYRVDRSAPVMIDLSENAEFESTIPLNFPDDAVNGSQYAQIAVAGDIMGPVMANLDSLVQMPYGCGEQNMVNFVPNIVAVNYMKATDQTDATLLNNAMKYMKAGYQREVTYRRDDGSFSAFGNSDEHGSTWLTAFVVRSFKQAQPHIFVDDKILESAIDYLNRQQRDNGEFGEQGTVHHKDMQGGASQGGVPITAYVTTAILEAGQDATKAVNYLENQLDTINGEAYSLALTAYALTLAKSSKANAAWDKYYSLIQSDNGLEYWSGETKVEKKEETYYYDRPRSLDVELTAYGLLTRVLRDEIAESVPMVRWLVSKRSATGAWTSTQDTVVGLQALAAYAEKAYSPTFNVQIDMKNGGDSHSFSVSPANALVLQQYELADLTAPVTISAKGSGIVFATVSYHWHLTKTRDDLPFECTKDVVQTLEGSEVTVGLCCQYKKSGKSNMAVLEVNALSGYQIDNEALNTLTGIKHLQRVESEKGDSKANIYFNELGAEPVCVNVTSQMAYQVSDQKEATMLLYDYYETDDRIEMAYSPREKRSLASVCADCWSNAVGSAEAAGFGNGVSTTTMSSLLVILLLLFV